MQEATNSLGESLADLNLADWNTRLESVAKEHGFYHQLGKRHFATFIDGGGTLLVSFETSQGIRALSEDAQPLGFEMVRSHGWSHLCLISNGDTWFRDPAVYEFMDGLIDDCFFEIFDNVVFYGAGPCGYAASAFSVSAPGATVLAIQPQATLDPSITEWDDRFTEMRHQCFTDRFGYAPDMLDAANKAFVFYDPRQVLDAMHAALFRSDHILRLRLPNMGGTLQTSLIEMNILYRLLELAGDDALTKNAFYSLYRARRDHMPYLRALMSRLDKEGRPLLNIWLCRNAISRLKAPRLGTRLRELEAQTGASVTDKSSREA